MYRDSGFVVPQGQRRRWRSLHQPALRDRSGSFSAGRTGGQGAGQELAQLGAGGWMRAGRRVRRVGCRPLPNQHVKPSTLPCRHDAAACWASAELDRRHHVPLQLSWRADSRQALAAGTAGLATAAHAANRSFHKAPSQGEVKMESQIIFDSCWRRFEDKFVGKMRTPREIIWLNGAPGAGKVGAARGGPRSRGIRVVQPLPATRLPGGRPGRAASVCRAPTRTASSPPAGSAGP